VTIFAAYDTTGAPLTGLTPSWIVVLDAGTGLAIAAPTFTNLGDGLYLIGAGTASSTAGIIDLGATAFPRYLHFGSSSRSTIVAYSLAGAPVAGLTPVWDSSVDGDGLPVVGPLFTDLGSGLYRIDYTGPDSRSGVMDFGATANPRYSQWSFDPFDADPPVISGMTPAPGDITATEPIEFDVVDIDPGLLRVIITLKYSSASQTIVVHDGTDFKPPFDTAESVRTAITDGFHYRLYPAGGWTGGFELSVEAIDGAGNLV
jgi:hypothetical protein